jgi:peptidoglycan hydrolase CwlO-like protein
MKRLLFITTCLLMLTGCNKNANKEARIRQLENEVTQITTELRDLENKFKRLKRQSRQTRNRNSAPAGDDHRE